MHNKNFDLKKLIKGILIILSYLIMPSIIYMPFYLLEKNNLINYQVSLILTYLCVLTVYVLIYRKNLQEDFKLFKKNYKKILLTTLKYWLIGLIIMIISSNIINLFGISSNVNQESNIELLTKYPIAEFVIACFFAPIIEELVFRCSLKNFTPNKHIYAITTGLIFGFVHVISSLDSYSSLTMLIYLIPFSAVGISFGYAYSKTKNIYGTMIIHSIHNLISLIEVIILGGIL